MEFEKKTPPGAFAFRCQHRAASVERFARDPLRMNPFGLRPRLRYCLLAQRGD